MAAMELGERAAFAKREERRAEFARAKTTVGELPEHVQQAKRDEIAAVETHCGRD